MFGWPKIDVYLFLSKGLIFWRFIFFDKISIFWQNFHFWRKFPFLEKISIFGENFYFWRKFLFLEKISIFLTKFSFLDNIFIFGQNFRFLDKRIEFFGQYLDFSKNWIFQHSFVKVQVFQKKIIVYFN